MTVEVRWLTTVDAISALAPEWRRLENAVTDRTPLVGCDYILPWYASYAGRSGRPLLGTAWKAGALVGVAPLVLRRGRVGGVPVRCVQFATAGGASGEFLLVDGRADLAGAFLPSLAARGGFDVARFNNLEPGGAVAAALRASARGARLAVEALPTFYARVDLSAGYEAYRARLSGKFRGNLRRRWKALAATGEPAVEGVHPESGAAGLEEALNRMFAISDRSWKARTGRGPMAEHHREFYRELARRHAARGQLDLSFLTVGGRDCAYMLGIVERGVYYDVTLSFDEAARPFAPGVLLMQEVLRRMASAGVHTAVSHGVHDYKRYFASALVPREHAYVFARRPRGLLSRSLRFTLAPVWARLGLLGRGAAGPSSSAEPAAADADR